MRNPKGPSVCLNSQLNGVTVMSPGGSTVPFGAETSGLTELKVMGTGSKSFASGPLSEIVGGTTPLSTTDSWTWESWIWEKQHPILHIDSEHIEPSGKPYPSLTRYQCLADAIESSKDHSAVLSSQLLQAGGETQFEFQ